MQYPLANENISQFQIPKTTHWKKKKSLLFLDGKQEVFKEM